MPGRSSHIGKDAARGGTLVECAILLVPLVAVTVLEINYSVGLRRAGVAYDALREGGRAAGATAGSFPGGEAGGRDASAPTSGASFECERRPAMLAVPAGVERAAVLAACDVLVAEGDKALWTASARVSRSQIFGDLYVVTLSVAERSGGSRRLPIPVPGLVPSPVRKSITFPLERL